MNLRPVGNIKIAGLWQRFRKKLDRNFLIFVFFLFLSSLFWLLNQLNREAIADISYPVRYTNLPGKKILANELPTHLELKVKAPGYTLMKSKMSPKFIPFNINLSTYFLRSTSGSGNAYFLLSRELLTRLKRRLTSDITVLEVQPDTLFFNFDSVVTRKLPVSPSITYSFLQQYWLKSPVTTDPDSVLVSGPASLVDTLKDVKTEIRDYSDLHQTVTSSLELLNISKLTYSINRIQVTIPVEQFTEAGLKIPIEPVNVPDSLVLKTFPLQVSLTCITGLDDYAKVSLHVFRAIVDYNAIDKSLGDKLQVIVASAPDYVRSVRIYPIYVDYIIERK